MRYDGRIGVLIFALAIFISVSALLLATPLYISDTDPTTYAIVPIMMLPIFAFFMLREKMVPEVDYADILLAIGLFAVLMAASLSLRFWLSYAFLGYWVEMLLFPVLIASLAIAIFGRKNVRRFRWIALYSIIASPVFFLPVIYSNQQFSVLNTQIVYGIVKLLYSKAVYSAPISILANGYRIGIGQACVGVGVLIGIVLFMAPLAYLYEGSKVRKAEWMLFGLLLLFLLNIVRMAGIALAWIMFGPTEALFSVHLIAGLLLFYISIIVTIILSGRFGLKLNSGRGELKQKSRGRQERKLQGKWAAGVAVALAISIVYLWSSLPYLSAQRIPLLNLRYQSYYAPDNSSFGQLLPSVVDFAGFNTTLLQATNSSASMLVWGNGINSTYPIVAYLGYVNSSDQSALLAKNMLLGKIYLIGKNGMSAEIYDLESNGTGFFVYDAKVPYVYGSGYSIIDVYLVMPSSDTGKGCGGLGFSNYLLNAFNPSIYDNTLERGFSGAYCRMMGMVV